MRRSILLTASLIALALLPVHPVLAQDGAQHPDLKLSVVGIGAKDYAESLKFYTKIMGLRSAFSFTTVTKTTNTYLQVSRDTFLELQTSTATNQPGLTHIHMETSNVDAIVARLRKAGLPSCTATLKTGCMNKPQTAQPTGERNFLIVDPSGIRFEPTQLTPGSLTRKAVDSWTGNDSERLLVVGIAVNDYPASEKFYEKVIGFPVAFKFTSPDGQRTTKYYQISRDSFLEMQPVTPTTRAGITHVHILTNDLTALIAKLKKAGLASAPRNGTMPNTVTEPGITQPSDVKSANVFDPNGIRLELNEWLPDSLPKKAADAWK
jgi:catechol 2,3-dioxygenase-like lactoylglutathione lyase family enzyme